MLLLAGLLTGCAAREVPPVGPAADPVRVADGLRVTPVESTLARATMVAAVTPLAIPINDQRFVSFCSADPSWLSRAPADRWYQVSVDGVRQDFLGPLVDDSGGCFHTSIPVVFTTPGPRTVTVQLVTPGALVVPDPAGTTDCTPGADCFGGASPPYIADVVVGVLAGAPPSIVSGQVVR